MPHAALKSAIEARESLRYPTCIDATLTVDASAMSCRIVDLSELGARIRLADRLPTGCRFRLTARGLDVQGRIVRITADGYGTKLDERIRPLQVVRSNA